jgi:hypothetical protein
MTHDPDLPAEKEIPESEGDSGFSRAVFIGEEKNPESPRFAAPRPEEVKKTIAPHAG